MRALRAGAQAARLHARFAPGACAAAALAPRAVLPLAAAHALSAAHGCRGGFARGAFDARSLCSAAAPPPPPPPPPVEPPAVAAAAAGGAGEPEREQSPELYTGPLAVTLRRVKLLSLGSLAVTVVGAPALVWMSSPEAVSVLAKTALSGSVVAFGCFTTALLSFFSSPYVLRLVLDRERGVAHITTLNLLARPVAHEVRLSEFREPQTLRPLATFAAQGRIFFLDGNIADAELLARLGLQKKAIDPAQEASGYDSDDEEEEKETQRKRK